jgi:Domain of unknown function (DUF5658)
VILQSELQLSRWRAIIWIAALQVLDIVTTYTAIKMVGASEANPMAKWLVDTYMIIAAKAFVVLLIVWFAALKPATVRTTAASWFCVGTYTLAIVLNTTHILKAGY